jgi:hypothetical protein
MKKPDAIYKTYSKTGPKNALFLTFLVDFTIPA